MKKQDQLEAVLTELGLSEKEAAVYLAAILLGPTTVMKIARMAEIKRPTVYSIIESLRQKGLMTIKTKGFKQLYVAENPNRLESIIEARKSLLQKHIDSFLSLYNPGGQKNIIKVYEGLDAMKAILEEILKEISPKDDYFVISDTEQWMSPDPEYFKHFAERRSKKRPNLKLLLIPSEKSLWAKKFEKNFNSQTKLLPANITFSANISITANKTVINYMKPPFTTIVIEHAGIVAMHRELFNILWQSYKY